MTLCLEKAHRAYVRLPRPLHAAMLELRAEHPNPVVFGTSQCVRFEERLTDWGLTAFMQIPDPHNPGATVRGDKLNGLGLAFAKHLQPLTGDKRTLPPLMPLADILADLPQPVFDWISTTPIKKHQGGILFEVLGVLLPDVEGEIYRPSRELALALDELELRRTGVLRRTDGPAHPLVSPQLASALTVCAHGRGVPWKNSDFDGRVLRPLLDSDGAGLISLRHMPINPANLLEGEEGRWVVPHNMQGVAKALADGHTDPFYLLTTCPDSYARWVANGCPIDSVPPHPKLLVLIGVVRKKGKYDWQLTPVGKDIQPRLAAHIRAYISGTGAVPDDSTYDGDGVDIVLPDEDGPAASDWDILGASPEQVAYLEQPGFRIQPETPGAADTISALEHLTAVAGQIIEAPVPSNAQLEAAGARRRGADITVEDHRQDYLDSVAPDEFDIL